MQRPEYPVSERIDPVGFNVCHHHNFVIISQGEYKTLASADGAIATNAAMSVDFHSFISVSLTVLIKWYFVRRIHPLARCFDTQ